MSKSRFIFAPLCMGLFLIIPNTMSGTPAPAERPEKKKQYNKLQLFEYSTEASYQPTRELIAAQYKICPPLRPGRFRRRVKMLWGIDINDYPANSVIIFNNYLMLSVKDQLIQGGKLGFWDTDKIPPAPPLPDSLYSLGRKFLFYDDASVYHQLIKNGRTYARKVVDMSEYYPMYGSDFTDSYDLLSQAYLTIIMTPTLLLTYIDKNNPFSDYSGSGVLSNRVDIFPLISKRTFDMRGDLLSLYIREQSKTRGLMVKSFDKKREKTDVIISCSGIELTYNPSNYVDDLDMHFPWHNYNLARSFAGNLSFLVQLQYKETNSYVIKYMSGQFDSSRIHSYTYKERQDSIRENIRSNNYYGYAILREFCENSEREMPTLEKVGTSFNACVINPKTLLYLEPYPDSYDIDMMQPAEIFKAYEMGYDDYYFVEVTKPVESPVAGPDGYAMILDRTETVYGYIRKTEIKEISEAEKVSKQITAQSTRKLGKIDDPDGYVNIRKESNADSEIIGKIVDKELFFYWEVPNSNWWYVQTNEEKQGFVHKSRIREKIDAGSWILDE